MLDGMRVCPGHELNQMSWEVRAAAHGQDSYYDTEGLLAGESSLVEEEEHSLARAFPGGIAGLEMLQVQCHLGFDAITFARRGANVTGVDFSQTALDKAALLARRAGVTARWLQADVCALPGELDGRFDLAWATVGILCWMADARAWMLSVARTLKPGGQPILIDGHPLAKMVNATTPLSLWGAYGGGVGEQIEHGTDYASDTLTGPQIQYAHSLGETVTAATSAGLRIVELIEHLDVAHDLYTSGAVAAERDGRYRLRVDGKQLSVLFTLRAVRDR